MKTYNTILTLFTSNFYKWLNDKGITCTIGRDKWFFVYEFIKPYNRVYSG